MEKQEWKSQFKSEITKQFSILRESSESSKISRVIETLMDSYYAKIESINIEALIKLDYKPENQREKSIIQMAMFLFEYEGKFSFCINFLCFLLISNGHDLFDMNRKKNYVTSFDDVETVDILTKCKFLVAHGFEIFDEEKNKNLKKFRKLRNDIAHYKFLIEDNGKIKVYNERQKNWEEVPILPTTGELMVFSGDMLLILWDCM